jgi:DNA repair exonuclease SbcCD nuclease subunit
MRASFIHIADTHLGYEQYGVRGRFNDFSQAFWGIIDDAIKRNVDFLIIAGDLFHKRAIDAQTLIHAIEGLKRLKDRDIPVIGIEGNHDRSFYRDGTSWLQFLCYQGYIKLLTPIMRDGAPQITPWQPGTMLGSHVDLLNGRLRVYGLHWQGASTARSLEGLVKALQEARSTEDAEGVEYRLLIMHTGVDGEVPRVQGLPTLAQFQPLRECVDYLALGHVHKPYEFAGWMYNPGSPETCSAEEAQWEKRGYYYVEIDTDMPERIIDPEKKERRHHAHLISNPRRPFVRYDLRVDALTEPEAVYERLTHYCQREGTRYKQEQSYPVVQIHLTGTLSFDVSALDTGRMEAMVRETFQPLYVRVDNHTNDQEYTPSEGDLDGRDRSVWHKLERRIFEDLVGLDARYLPAKEQWGAVLSEIKQSALRKEDSEQIAQYLRGKREELLG